MPDSCSARRDLRRLPREDVATIEIARREHVILCGFGRVGQNIARVLESQGFEYIALDLDPARIRAARQAGDPVIFGDSADEDLLVKMGLQTASAVVISFSDPATSLGILHSVRRLRPDVPVLVRTADDVGIKELQDAGATDVVPETFEASLMLVSHVLMLLHVPVSRVVRTVNEIRNNRYAVLRNIVRRGDARPLDETHEHREEIKSVVVPPGAWAVGRTLGDVRGRGVEVVFTGIRRLGIPRSRARRGHGAARRRHCRDLWTAGGARARRIRAAGGLRSHAVPPRAANPMSAEGTIMHKSRLAGFIIDCQTDDIEGAAAFWSDAPRLQDQVLGASRGRRLSPPGYAAR